MEEFNYERVKLEDPILLYQKKIMEEVNANEEKMRKAERISKVASAIGFGTGVGLLTLATSCMVKYLKK